MVVGLLQGPTPESPDWFLEIARDQAPGQCVRYAPTRRGSGTDPAVCCYQASRRWPQWQCSPCPRAPSSGSLTRELPLHTSRVSSLVRSFEAGGEEGLKYLGRRVLQHQKGLVAIQKRGGFGPGVSD
eukprot:103088-Rhodomonas_salina.2